MPKIKFKIVTPERVVFEKEVSQVTLPTQTGQITVLPDHIPLLSVLCPGEVIVKWDKEEIYLAISSGFLEVRKNEVVVLTETAERSDEIDEARAEQARKRAEQILQDTKNKEAVDYTALAAKIEKELVRLRVVRKRKSSFSATKKLE